MKRRSFLKNALPASITLPAVLNGFSVQAFTNANPLVQALMGNTTETDKVLVIVQLVGGNDGLNMVIPIENYANYYGARKNIAIAQNKVLPLNGTSKTGLHPGMTGLQTLYNEGKLSIIQSVGYPSPNFSHFRATDIWMSAPPDADTVVYSGWAGRYLNLEFPNFPNGYPTAQMPDPLAIQIGSVQTLELQGPTFPMGMNITDPTSFYDFLDNVGDPVPNTPWGKELEYIRMIMGQTEVYSNVIRAAAAKVTSQGSYPSNNRLAQQLRIVARLIKGGLKTRIYKVTADGFFDTHASQVEAADTTTGNHAQLMARLSDGIKSFMDDLKGLGIDDRVLGFTYSEFGRRINSNSSLGTDHGAAAPVFVFGKHVRGGIIGTNPTISTDAKQNDNVPYQYDFRSIYASLLQQWFCVKDSDLQTILFKNYQNIPLAINEACGITGITDLRNDGEQLIINYPNPFVETTKITFTTKGGHTLVQVMDTMGRVIKTLTDKDYTSGTYTVTFDGYGLANGVYYARFQNGVAQQVRPMLKTR